MVARSDIELPDQGDKIIRTKNLDINPNSKGFGHELFVNMKKHSNKVAQMDAETGRRDTFKTLLRRCVRVALHLKKRGITPEDVVSPCTCNHLNTAVAMVAPLLIGAKIACMDPFATIRDIKAMTNLVKPKIILACKEAEGNIEQTLEELNLNAEIIVFGQTKKHTSIEKLLEPLPMNEERNFAPFEAKDIFDTAIIIFTSGSTGIPKGIYINHYSILCQVTRSMMPMSTTIIYAGLVWVTGQIYTTIHLLSGSTKLICCKPSPAKTWRYLVKYNVVTLCFSHKDAMAFLKYGNSAKLETPNLKTVIVNGEKFSVKNMDAMKDIFSHPILVLNPYGISEVYGSALDFSDIKTLIKKPESAGKPMMGFWYKVVDLETGKVCGPNERGELHLKSKINFRAYHNRDSSYCFDPDGFLKTGDMAYYDEEHSFFIVDRIRHALKYKLCWISSTLLESILYQHPSVKVACVIGVPSKEGNLATAMVVKSSSGGDVTEEDLIKFVNDNVDDIRRIRGGVTFMEESAIPFTPTGKIRKFLLRPQLLEKIIGLDAMMNDL